jgi:hemolysin-activating ACP:hemolysin acyltransferase
MRPLAFPPWGEALVDGDTTNNFPSRAEVQVDKDTATGGALWMLSMVARKG